MRNIFKTRKSYLVLLCKTFHALKHKICSLQIQNKNLHDLNIYTHIILFWWHQWFANDCMIYNFIDVGFIPMINFQPLEFYTGMFCLQYPPFFCWFHVLLLWELLKKIWVEHPMTIWHQLQPFILIHLWI